MTGRPPFISTRWLSSLKRKRSVCCSSRKVVSPTSSILTQRSIWRRHCAGHHRTH